LGQVRGVAPVRELALVREPGKERVPDWAWGPDLALDLAPVLDLVQAPAPDLVQGRDRDLVLCRDWCHRRMALTQKLPAHKASS
jgi:hypothetical protein